MPRSLILTLGLLTVTGAGCNLCGNPGGEDGGTPCSVTFQDPRDNSTLTTAADDNDGDAANGIQFDVRVATDCPDGTSVTLSNDENGEEATASVDGTTITFEDFTIDASPSDGTSNILSVLATPTGEAETEDIITITGVDDGGNEDPTCTFTSPADGATVTDADVNAPNFQIATAVRCTNTAAGDEVRIQAGDDTGVTVSLDAQGAASATVTSTETEGTVSLLVFLVDDAAVNATIDVILDEDTPACDATISSPADDTVFGAGSPDQSADAGFQILVRVDTLEECDGATATVTIGGDETTGLIGTNGQADIIITIPEGSSDISASVTLDGDTGAADTISVTYEPGAIGMTFDVPTCGTFGDGCFNALAGDSAPGSATIEQNITVFAPAVDGACPYTDPTITVDGGTAVGGATWTYSTDDDRCEATFTNLTLTEIVEPDGLIVALAVTASTNDGQEEVANFNLGVDFLPSAITVVNLLEGQQLNAASDPNLADGYNVNFQVLTPNLRDGAEVDVVFSATGETDVVEVCVVNLEGCQINPLLGDGAWSALVTATDEAGNVSTLTRTFEVDATLPTVTSITLAIDANDDATVNIAEGGVAPLTSTVTVATDLAAGQLVTLDVGGTDSGEVAAAADGSVTFAGVNIPEGAAVVVSVSGTDPFGNPFAVANTERTYNIDVTAPVITIAVPDIVADGLLLADDDVAPGTAGMQIDFAVATDVPNANVTLSDDGGAAATEAADGTGLAVFDGFLLAEGVASVTATVSDAAGNSSTTPVYAPIVDSIRPTVTIDAPADNFDLNASNDGDANPNNGLQTTVTVSTTGVPVGDAVCVDSSVEGEIGCAPAEADGTVDIPVTFLTDASHEITARGDDENTNTGTSDAVTVNAATGIYSLAVLTPALVDGVRGIGAENDTDDGVPGAQAEICVDAGENLLLGTVFQLFVNDTLVPGAIFSVNQTGACVINTFGDGTSGTFEVTIEDLGGKTGTTGSQAFAVDLAVPVVSITAPAANDVLNIAADANVALAGIQFSVAYTTDKAGSLTVLDSDGATIAGPVTVSAGAGTITVSDTTEHDAGDWTVRVTDDVGNEGEATVNVTVDFIAPSIDGLALVLESRREGLLRAEFTEGGDNGADGANVASLEVVASNTAITNDAEFDAAIALDGSPNEGGLFEGVAIGGATTAHSDISIPLAYARTWTIAVRAIDDAGNSTIVSDTNDEIATVLTLRSDADDDVAPADTYADDFGFLSLGSGDLDDDGFDDLVVASPNEGDECLFADYCRGRIRVFRGGANGSGDLALEPAEVLNPGPDTSFIGFLSLSIIESFNDDGFDDLIAQGYADDFSSFIELSYGQGTAPYIDIANSVRFTVGPFGTTALRARIVGDVNDDGRADLAITAKVDGAGGASTVYIVFGSDAKLTGTIDLTAGGPNIAILRSSTSELGRATVAMGDLTGDGIDDFAIDGAAPDHILYIVPGRTTWPDSTTDFEELDGLPGPTCPGVCGIELSAGDVNGDGLVDLVALDVSATLIFLQGAGGTFPASASYALLTGGNTTQSARGGLSVDDLNGDGRADIVVTSVAEVGTGHPSGFGLFFGDARTSGTKLQADTYYELPFVSGDGANVGACGNLDGSANGLPEFCYGVSYAVTGGIDGEVHIRN